MFRLYVITALILAAGVAYSFPTAIVSESKTKGTTTVSTQYLDKIMFKTSAITTVSINGTGTGWPTVANTDYTWNVGPGVTSLVFSRTSSAAASPTVVYSAR